MTIFYIVLFQSKGKEKSKNNDFRFTHNFIFPMLKSITYV
jgi:hypothetical protein